MSKNITRSIPIAQLDEWGLPYERPYMISVEVVDVGRRWMDEATCVFKAPDDGLTYSFTFDVGKTENQQEHWTYELADPVVCTRVKLVQVKVDKWVPFEVDGDAPAVADV